MMNNMHKPALSMIFSVGRNWDKTTVVKRITSLIRLNTWGVLTNKDFVPGWRDIET